MKHELSQANIDKIKKEITSYIYILGLELGDSIQFNPDYIYIEVHSDTHEIKMRIEYPTCIRGNKEYVEYIKLYITRSIVKHFMGAATVSKVKF